MERGYRQVGGPTPSGVILRPLCPGAGRAGPGVEPRDPTGTGGRVAARKQETSWTYHCSEPRADGRTSSSRGGEWAVLWLSVAAALLAIGVGFYLARSVMAADEGTPKMREIAALSRKALRPT